MANITVHTHSATWISFLKFGSLGIDRALALSVRESIYENDSLTLWVDFNKQFLLSEDRMSKIIEKFKEYNKEVKSVYFLVLSERESVRYE